MESSSAATPSAPLFDLAPPALPRTWADDVVDWSWWTSMQPGDFSWGPVFFGVVAITAVIGVGCLLAVADWVKPSLLAKQLAAFGWSMLLWGVVGLFLLTGRAASVPGLSPRILWAGYGAGVLLTLWYFWEVRWPRESEKEQLRKTSAMKQKYL